MENSVKVEEDAVKPKTEPELVTPEIPAHVSPAINEDPEFNRKCVELTELLRSSTHTIVYSGAGISTSAQIPDYRGPNGIWTLQHAGKPIEPFSILRAEPTYTHLAIRELVEHGFIKYIVSQNCDGLHLRSGLSPEALSELHGNALIETCTQCGTTLRRRFDVTIRRTAQPESTEDSQGAAATRPPRAARRGVHETDRQCAVCGASLTDTLVRFGERIPLSSEVHKFEQALSHAELADHILCVGTSLVVLRAYKRLWPTARLRNARRSLEQANASKSGSLSARCTFLSVVNLGRTAKDKQATLRIAARCDDVMKRVMQLLNITVRPYTRDADPYLTAAMETKPLSKFPMQELDPMQSACESDIQPQSAIYTGSMGMGVSTWGMRVRTRKRRFAMLGKSRRKASKRLKGLSQPDTNLQAASTETTDPVP